MYTRPMRPHIHADPATPTYLGLRIIWNNYYAMYKRLTRSRRRVESASSAYLGLGII